MSLRVYNTLTRQKEEFQTVQPGKVGMYVCGPTVYKPSHVGHMVGPVIFDTVKRYLTYLGYQVTWIVNITDVDDKLIGRAAQIGTSVQELAEQMTCDYLDCLERLNVTGIDHMPRATQHIAEMIRMMQGLIEKGYAYAAGGDVYFDITKDPDYGKLCHRDPEQMEAGSRIEVSEKKRNPGDFAMWKGSKPGEPAWDSPWGPGRPGWHIECSAMSMKYLGETLDIHGGGLDLQFPHHENELAQSESYTNRTFARYWMHNGLLKMGTAKMAGSVGNVVNVVDLFKQHSAETVRFLLLNTHYSSPIEWSDERLTQIQRNVDSFYRFFERFELITGNNFYQLPAPGKLVESKLQGKHEPGPTDRVGWLSRNYGRQFLEQMDDDFNTGGAVAFLFGVMTLLNHQADKERLEEKGKPSPDVLHDFIEGTTVLRELSNILGLFSEPPAKKELGGDDALVAGLMQLLIDVRNNLRAEAKKVTAKDDPLKKALFDQTDLIRKRLAELGVTLEDRPGGTGWRVG
jgi:cysteinyl-tRNA synthetase